MGSGVEDLIPLKEYYQDLRQADRELGAERDRRYAEVNLEREKALKIKETADRDALGLAREIQTYKDEKANELRSQIERERGSYVTQSDLRGSIEKLEAILKPLSDYVSSKQGGSSTLASTGALIVGVVGVTGVIVSLILLLKK